MRVVELGFSIEARKLQAKFFDADQSDLPPLVFLGGVHGDEIEGVWLLDAFLNRCCNRSFKRTVIFFNPVNPDGVALNTRQNARGVDLNRNLPTKDWSPQAAQPRYAPGISPASEPENLALIALIEKISPCAILSVHSFSNPQVNSNGPALSWAKALSNQCGYVVTEDIGYPTPGSLGTYAGKERQIPTITLEILRGLTQAEVLAQHVPTLEACLEYWKC